MPLPFVTPRNFGTPKTELVSSLPYCIQNRPIYSGLSTPPAAGSDPISYTVSFSRSRLLNTARQQNRLPQ
jgi:hypothetical protein